MNIKKIIEELEKNITEDNLVDEFEIEDPVDNFNPILADTSTTELLDKKTQISRSLDVLKQAIQNFKDATIAEAQLLADGNELLKAIEGLDIAVIDIDTQLKGKSVLSQEPAVEEHEEIPDNNIEDEEVEDDNIEDEEDNDDDEDDEDDEDEEDNDDDDTDFATEASLNLFDKEK